MMAQLVLENMEFYAYHGHYNEENVIGGRFSVSVVLETDISRAADSDKLEDAVDYSRVYSLVKQEMSVPSRLLEHLARRIADAVYSATARIERITVTVSKLNPAIGGKMDRFSVTVTK